MRAPRLHDRQRLLPEGQSDRAELALPAGNAGWEQEISLDLDAVSALCPNCHILLVEAAGAYTSDLNQAFAKAAAMGANQISNSCSGEDTLPPTDAYSSAGVPAVFATGDSGYNS